MPFLQNPVKPFAISAFSYLHCTFMEYECTCESAVRTPIADVLYVIDIRVLPLLIFPIQAEGRVYIEGKPTQHIFPPRPGQKD
jgi:hypothetical protein